MHTQRMRGPHVLGQRAPKLVPKATQALQTVVGSLQTALGNETAARTQADQALQTALQVEATARQQGDQNLQNALNQGVIGLELVSAGPIAVSPGQQGAVNVLCPTGKKVTGGGYQAGDNTKWSTVNSGPVFGTSGWTVRLENIGNVGSSFTAFAICVTAI